VAKNNGSHVMVEEFVAVGDAIVLVSALNICHSQETVPAGVFVDTVDVPAPWQRDAGVLVGVFGATGVEGTVNEIGFEVAGLPVGQFTLEVSTQVTWSVAGVVIFIVAVVPVPEGTAFKYHWYDGVEPPLVGVAENETFVPAQMFIGPSMGVCDVD